MAGASLWPAGEGDLVLDGAGERMGQPGRGGGSGGAEPQQGWKGLLGSCQPQAWVPGPGDAAPPRRQRRLPESGDLVAKHLEQEGRELHAALGLEREAAVLLGVLLVQAAQVRQLLDHLGIEQVAAWGWVAAADVGLQRVGQAVLDGLDQRSILHSGAVCGQRRRVGAALSRVPYFPVPTPQTDPPASSSVTPGRLLTCDTRPPQPLGHSPLP